MNTDELKIIMDALVALGDAGKTGFIWWLVMKYGLHYLLWMIFVVAAAVTVRNVFGKITSMSHGNQLGQELCHLLKTTDSEYRGWDNENYRSKNKAEILNRVRELIKLQPE